MVQEYFLIAGIALQRAHDAVDGHSSKRDCVVAVMMSVTAVEGFLNVYFRKIVEEPKFRVHRTWIQSDLSSRLSLDRKIRKWPEAVFGRGLDFDTGAAQEFMRHKGLRNHIVHFSAEPTDLQFENFTFRGMLDTTRYDAIDFATATDVMNCCVGVIREILSLNIEASRLPGHLHAWTGFPQADEAG